MRLALIGVSATLLNALAVQSAHLIGPVFVNPTLLLEGGVALLLAPSFAVSSIRSARPSPCDRAAAAALSRALACSRS